jgi:acylphosphatase
MKRVRARVFGRVQGVFFRDRTRQTARGLGVCGFVRNCEDGSVEVVAEGSAEAVESLVAFLRCGPPLARVSRVELEEEEFGAEFDHFRVV